MQTIMIVGNKNLQRWEGDTVDKSVCCTNMNFQCQDSYKSQLQMCSILQPAVSRGQKQKQLPGAKMPGNVAVDEHQV